MLTVNLSQHFKDNQQNPFFFKTLAVSVDALNQLLSEATLGSIGQTTEMIVSSQNSVDELLSWLELHEGPDSVEVTMTRWRLCQLKLMLARNIELDAEGRSRAFERVEQVNKNFFCYVTGHVPDSEISQAIQLHDFPTLRALLLC